MLKIRLLHPTILNALARSGHGSMILIPDGNYPFNTGTNPAAEHVFLNLSPGLVTVTQVLDALLTAVPVEAAHVMQPDDGSEPPIFAEFRQRLSGLTLQKLERFAFYDFARTPNVSLVVATGDQRLYANLMLTIGVVPPT